MFPVSGPEPVLFYAWIRKTERVGVEQGNTPDSECIRDEVGGITCGKVGNRGYTDSQLLPLKNALSP